MSNGSSSMATACATSLALMDAGVPVSAPVGGISGRGGGGVDYEENNSSSENLTSAPASALFVSR